MVEQFFESVLEKKFKKAYRSTYILPSNKSEIIRKKFEQLFEKKRKVVLKRPSEIIGNVIEEESPMNESILVTEEENDLEMVIFKSFRKIR